MNWSEYSRYVGDIFGAPLAMEGLAAFFLESTFLGLWIFGWGRLSPKRAPGDDLADRVRDDPLGLLHPRRQLVDAAPGRLRDQPRHPPRRTEEHLRGAHQLDRCCWRSRTRSSRRCAPAASSCWRSPRSALLRRRGTDVYSRSIAQGAAARSLVAAVLTGAFGHTQGMLMEKQQPMKMAAAEALYKTTQGREPVDLRGRPVRTLPQAPEHRHPHPAPAVDPRHRLLERDSQGRQPAQRRRPGEIRPGRLRADPRRHLLDVPPDGRRRRAAAADPADRPAARAPQDASSARAGSCGSASAARSCRSLANLTGWIFTEMGRQPWVVYGLLKTTDARSPLVGSGSIIITIVGYTLLYGVLLVVGGRLFLREIAHGPRTRAADARAPADARARRHAPRPRSSPTENGAPSHARPQLPADPLVRC